MLTQQQVKGLQRVLEHTTDALPHVFQAVADPGRWKIFRLMAAEDNLCVTDVAHVLNVSVPAASQQLRIMEMAGLIVGERDGQMMCYRIRKDSAYVKLLLKFYS